jgi:two-component SAPR family response regulator
LLDCYHNTNEVICRDYGKDKEDVEDVKELLNKYSNSFWTNNYSNWKQRSFAYKLKQIICILTGCTMEQLENNEFKNSIVMDLSTMKYDLQKDEVYDMTYRQLLQFVGTDLFRNQLYDKIWIDALFVDY